MKNDMFFLKVLTTESPYYQIVRGNFRYEDAAMKALLKKTFTEFMYCGLWEYSHT